MSIEQSHIIDEIETARTKLLRANRAAIRLLTDALSANEDGRVEIVQEFLERAISGLEESQI